MPKTSPLADREAFALAANQSSNTSQVLRALGLRAAGGNHAAAKKWADIHGIELPQQSVHEPRWIAVSDDEVFCVDSPVARNTVRKRLIKLGEPYVCALCRIPGTWMGKPITLHLDHINGVHNDNRRENLRFLCPNCDAVQETYKARNIKGKPSKPSGPRSRPYREKIEWPPVEELRQRLRETSYSALAREIGVSDTAVKKRIKTHG